MDDYAWQCSPLPVWSLGGRYKTWQAHHASSWPQQNDMMQPSYWKQMKTQGLSPCQRAIAHSLGAPGPTPNTVLLCPLPEGDGTKWSAITSGSDQYTNLVCNHSVITQSQIHFCQGSHCGCSRHVSGGRLCGPVFTGWGIGSEMWDSEKSSGLQLESLKPMNWWVN